MDRCGRGGVGCNRRGRRGVLWRLLSFRTPIWVKAAAICVCWSGRDELIDIYCFPRLHGLFQVSIDRTGCKFPTLLWRCVPQKILFEIIAVFLWLVPRSRVLAYLVWVSRGDATVDVLEKTCFRGLLSRYSAMAARKSAPNSSSFRLPTPLIRKNSCSFAG